LYTRRNFELDWNALVFMRFSEIHGLLRFGVGLSGLVRETVSPETAKAILRRRMARRQEALLEMLERAVFGHSRSPYRALFKHAGCELGDVRDLLYEDGMDSALEKLRDAGVYVTLEEFKGLIPARRGSASFDFRGRDFDNPLSRGHFASWTGGTSGKIARVSYDLDLVAQAAQHWAIWYDAHGLLAANSPLVMWWPGHAGAAMGNLLALKAGKPYVKWFVPVRPEAFTDRIGTALIHRLVRRAGDLSRPEFSPGDSSAKVLAFVQRLIQRGNRPCVRTTPSQAMRLCHAADDEGLSLEAVTFLLGGEPLTPTRRQIIEDHGAAAVPLYGSTDGGNFAFQCPNGAGDDVHLMSDAYSVIQRKRRHQDHVEVDALLFTGMLPALPKILLNTEIGDHGVVESRSCGCAYDDLGCTRHIHSIRSFSKVTAEGMTVFGADLFELMEDVLPRRFGGRAGDYQLVEEQDPDGLTRCTILVSPEVQNIDEKDLIDAFTSGVATMRRHYAPMTTVWRDAGSIRVERRRPIATGRGKIFPYRLR
jgi:hypothetical protein